MSARPMTADSLAVLADLLSRFLNDPACIQQLSSPQAAALGRTLGVVAGMAREAAAR